MILSVLLYKKDYKSFWILGFKIEIFSNIKIANFRDITFDNLSDNSYRPFLKTNQYPSYVNTYPSSSIIKQVPKAVNTRMRRLSSNEIFHESCKLYIEALKNRGFKRRVYLSRAKKIKPNNNNDLYKNKGTTDNCNIKEKCHKNRKRKKIWFKPPFCKLANINTGKIFFKLIDKHFNQYNTLHKIFNRKTLKISYSCTNNFF